MKSLEALFSGNYLKAALKDSGKISEGMHGDISELNSAEYS